MDSETHKHLTRFSNEIILMNIKKLSIFSMSKVIKPVIRFPLVPELIGREVNLAQTASFVSALEGRPELNLLPYHAMGEKKYEMMGADYPLEGLSAYEQRAPKLQEVLALCRSVASETRVSLGGDAVLWED